MNLKCGEAEKDMGRWGAGETNQQDAKDMQRWEPR